MLYAVICYNSESVVGAWSKEKDDAVMAHHQGVMAKFAAKGKLGPVARLMPTTTSTTVRPGREMMVLDGPFAETKEQLLGFYLFDCETLDEVIAAARELAHEPGCVEIRPVMYFHPGAMNAAAGEK
ncbi:MAG TPA: YciI family protein [Steroidobacter sp.]|uniref:YciI family protein n=1 Tax=Steroidobacter sp. TaxID=1978227 RepID=UPI002ED910BA